MQKNYFLKQFSTNFHIKIKYRGVLDTFTVFVKKADGIIVNNNFLMQQ